MAPLPRVQIRMCWRACNLIHPKRSFFFALAAMSFGQTGRITGTVADDSGMPVAGAIRHGAARGDRAGNGEEVRGPRELVGIARG
jgi:hypothetical protein